MDRNFLEFIWREVLVIGTSAILGIVLASRERYDLAFIPVVITLPLTLSLFANVYYYIVKVNDEIERKSFFLLCLSVGLIFAACSTFLMFLAGLTLLLFVGSVVTVIYSEKLIENKVQTI